MAPTDALNNFFHAEHADIIIGLLVAAHVAAFAWIFMMVRNSSSNSIDFKGKLQ